MLKCFCQAHTLIRSSLSDEKIGSVVVLPQIATLNSSFKSCLVGNNFNLCSAVYELTAFTWCCRCEKVSE